MGKLTIEINVFSDGFFQEECLTPHCYRFLVLLKWLISTSHVHFLMLRSQLRIRDFALDLCGSCSALILLSFIFFCLFCESLPKLQTRTISVYRRVDDQLAFFQTDLLLFKLCGLPII